MLHVYCFYAYATNFYSAQLKALVSLGKTAEAYFCIIYSEELILGARFAVVQECLYNLTF